LAGSARYSRPALNGLDLELDRFLDRDGGVFVEAGGNDGFTQSNTYYLEAMRGWTGLLVEPLPHLASECLRNRPRSKVAQAALVPPGHGGSCVKIFSSGLTSTVEGAFGGGRLREEHHRRGLAAQDLDAVPAIDVPARLLSDLIDEHLDSAEIDLLVLDVEGYELEALLGLDLDRHAPRFACIECRDQAPVAHLLSPRMRPIKVLHDNHNYADVLFARDDWDD
jgi:FkbM family methyltransferase